MSRNRNDRQRSDYLHGVALALVDKKQYDGLPATARKAMRVVWQKQLQQRTGCTPFTARAHIRKALEDGIPNTKIQGD